MPLYNGAQDEPAPSCRQSSALTLTTKPFGGFGGKAGLAAVRTLKAKPLPVLGSTLSRIA